VEVTGWVLDKSAAVRSVDPDIGHQLHKLAGQLFICPIGELEQLYSAQSAQDYDLRRTAIHTHYGLVAAPPDLLARVLHLQHDLAHHHGMWHRVPLPDLMIAETALEHGLGVVSCDGDYDRIAKVRPLVVRRLS
jgi:predicted nucleic acid-binding protein